MNLDDHLAAASAALRQPADEATVERAYRTLEWAYRQRRNTADELADVSLDWMVEAECAYRAAELAEQHDFLSVAAAEFQVAAEFGFGDACVRLTRVLARVGRAAEAQYWCGIAQQEGYAEAAELLADRCPSGAVDMSEPDRPADHLEGDDGCDPQALEDEHVARRRFLARAAAITFGVTGPTPGRDGEPRHLMPARVSQAEVTRWRVTSAAVHRLARLYGGAACAAPVHSTLSLAGPLRDRSGDDVVGRQMLAVLAELHSLAGWADAYSGSPAMSLIHFHVALGHARAAHDDGLLSQILCRAGCVYLEGDLPTDALKMFQLGQIAAAESGDDLRVALLCALEAWCYSMLREDQQAIKLLRRVHHELERVHTPTGLLMAPGLEVEYIQRLAVTLHELLRYKADADRRRGRHLRPLLSLEGGHSTPEIGPATQTSEPGTEHRYATVVSLLQDVRPNDSGHGGPDCVDLRRLVERHVRRAG